MIYHKGSDPLPSLWELFVKWESHGYYFHEAEGIFKKVNRHMLFP